MAKLYGNYNSLSEGSCLDALIDLTNCPSFEKEFKEYDNKDKLWEDFKKWIDYEYILSIVANQTEVPDNLNVKTDELTYTILKYYEDKKENIRIVKLRNIWGVFSWKGDWS